MSPSTKMTSTVRVRTFLNAQARLSDADLDAERQIVVEEWRQSRSGGMRASEHYGRLLLEGSKYADRFPIGLMEVRQLGKQARRRASGG